MDVFISWSGERSKALAEGLREFLQLVVQSAKPFVSGHIEAGQRWLTELNERLEKTRFAIICLTPENVESRWIHYEAGALGKALDNSRVCPCLYGLSNAQVEGPLAQFQMNTTDEEGIRKIVGALNRAMGDSALSEATLQSSFTAFWPKLQSVIAGLADMQVTPSVKPRREVDEMVEEILTIVRRQATTTTTPAPAHIWVESKTIPYSVYRSSQLKDELYDMEQDLAVAAARWRTNNDGADLQQRLKSVSTRLNALCESVLGGWSSQQKEMAERFIREMRADKSEREPSTIELELKGVADFMRFLRESL